MGHVVPIDRQAGAAQVGAQGEADPFAARQLPELLPVAGGLQHLLHAIPQPAARHPQVVHRVREGLHQVPESEGDGVHGQVLRQAVHVDLQGEARLRRAVPPLGAAGGLVRVDPRPLELVGGNVVGGRLQGARVVGRHDPIAAVAAAVQEGTEVHGGDAPVLVHARPHPHEDGVPATMGVEDLLPGEGDLHRPAGDHG